MKLLKDWTLEEAHNYCIGYRFSHENNCVGCKLFKQCRHSFGSFDFIPPTQQKTIVWHPYPLEIPPKEGKYLVTTSTNFISTAKWITSPNYTFVIPVEVIAWAEHPNPYKEKEG